ncbi:hypothetical protein AXG93_392s1380 [Marchantia polymorpha subsp. ruderalis]|uniref:Uncharacterized protein n=1 Tax=Marchantia polymorpha subsp. ruderalis TaxID=1480154 RepID=A0A176WQB1_MARPO|nr:hypothetical protein AXG93_392s1380 [Marchantia polymorpha subsp. ruderalis]
MVQEWDDDDAPKPDGYLGNSKKWQIWDWAKVLGHCVEQKKFMLKTHAENAYETLGVNEVNTEQEETHLALPSERTNGLRDRGEEGPQKRRKVAVSKTLDQHAEMRVRRPVPTKLKTANV